MVYWLCITNEWKGIKDKNIWGVPERHKSTIMKVESGDRFIYLKQGAVNDETKPSRIVAIYEVMSEQFKDSTRVFKDKEIFPWRVKIKPAKFRSLITKLKFIANKKKWMLHLRGKATDLL